MALESVSRKLAALGLEPPVLEPKDFHQQRGALMAEIDRINTELARQRTASPRNASLGSK